MSDAAAVEFLERVDWDEGDYVELERGEREPMTLIANPDTPASDVHRLLARLEDVGYEVDREYAGDKQAAYAVYHPGYGGESA